MALHLKTNTVQEEFIKIKFDSIVLNALCARFIALKSIKMFLHKSHNAKQTYIILDTHYF